MSEFYVLRDLSQSRWAKSLYALERALVRGDKGDKEVAGSAYARLYHALLLGGAKGLGDAAVSDLLSLETPFSELAMRGRALPEGLRAGVLLDLERFAALVLRDWQGEVSRLLSRTLPPLTALRGPADKGPSAAFETSFVKSLKEGAWEEALTLLERHYREHGAGSLSRFEAFCWVDGDLKGIAHPAKPELSRLVGLERQLARLQANTEALLAGLPAQHALLYGPRGSGKSTAVRALLPRYSAEGLRLIELHPEDMADMVTVMERLRGRPHAYVLFVDDLSFEDHAGYGPLKTLLEGSLTEPPDNVLVYATSNRRHLVRERFSDRPDPLNDDVHGWDTVNERLALADRFGLTLTFPSATQTRYLQIVRGLAAREELDVENLAERAVRFADWGNGYSGRTAQQFIDGLKADGA